MESSRRDLFNDRAECMPISKNNQTTYHRRVGFTPETGIAFPKPKPWFSFSLCIVVLWSAGPNWSANQNLSTKRRLSRDRCLPDVGITAVDGSDGPRGQVLGLEQAHLQLLGGGLEARREPHAAQVVVREEQVVVGLAGPAAVQRRVDGAQREAACNSQQKLRQAKHGLFRETAHEKPIRPAHKVDAAGVG